MEGLSTLAARPSPGLAVLGALAAALAATAPRPAFSTSNQGVIARSFALPAIGAPRLLAPGQGEARATLDWTNEFHAFTGPRDQLLLDGETQRWALAWRRGLAPGFEAGIELPVLHQGGGVLDGFIEDWHEVFGLPNGGREAAPQDRFRRRYVRDGRTWFDRADGGTALGDLRLSGAWQARESVALRALVQLPTGDDAELAAGNAGGALWLDAALDGDGRWQSHASAGLSLAADAGLAPGQRRWVPFGGAGTAFAWSEDLAFAAQVYAHGGLYDGALPDAFSRAGVQLAFGGSYRCAPGARVDLALQEDLVTRSSPDFSIHLALRLDTGVWP